MVLENDEIHGKSSTPTPSILLNALDIEISRATLCFDSTVTEAISITHDVRKEQVTVNFSQGAPVGKTSRLILNYTGHIRNDMTGFYRSKYIPASVPPATSTLASDGRHYMLSTFFEPGYARMALPCFDEPNLKSTFDFAIEIPDDQVALSNMPVKNISPVPTKQRRVVVTFDRSPAMSTYLLSWAIGDFEYAETFTDRLYSGQPLPFIDYFSDIFGVEYPLPKSDILAVHEFSHGAMENWGLVMYRMSAILFDEQSSEERFKDRIAYVVAHELAHQWFGNLVTMDWWDDLWLNEGFATWAGFLAVDHVHPEWEFWTRFVNEGMQSAFEADSIRASHSIQVQVRNVAEVSQLFDLISYRKGASIIRMLANHIGLNTFLKGISVYLKRHTYGNAITDDLWDALSEVSKMDVSVFVRPWVEKMGFPVISIEENGSHITVKQDRFLSTGDAKPGDNTSTWWIPLCLGGNPSGPDIANMALTKKEDIFKVSSEFYKVNANAIGFYKVNYPTERLSIMASQLNRLSTEDKIFTISSAADMAFAGYNNTAAMLHFLEGFGRETHYRVIKQALDSVQVVQSIFHDDHIIRKGLGNFVLQLIERNLSMCGWDYRQGEDYNTTLSRNQVLLAAGINGHPEVTSEAIRRFTAYKSDSVSNPIHPNLRAIVFRVAIATNPIDTVPFLIEEWAKTYTIDGKEICLTALGHATELDVIASDVLPLLFNAPSASALSMAIPAGDMHFLSASLAENPVTRLLQWSWVKVHWSSLEAKIGKNAYILDRLVGTMLQTLTDASVLSDIEKFFETKNTTAFRRTLEVAKDKIRGRAGYRERDGTNLRKWLTINGYV
ncbi:peptidase family m1 [Trichoderma arundinaceum]|uniref:Aminopeptidase n=1 Tax=Trichoderma arundinaceum TaxID=490622 RepID=A0A395P0D2_TRIAR|nr:peptidase family m1 [Trichoderma arundinaceum]